MLGLLGGVCSGCAADRIPPSRDSLKLDDTRSTADSLQFSISRGPHAGLRVRLSAEPLALQTFQGFHHAELTVILAVDNGSPKPAEFDLTRFTLEAGGARVEATQMLENGSPIKWLRVIAGEARSARLTFKFGSEKALRERPVVTLLWCYEIDDNLYCRRNSLALRLAGR